MKNESSSIFSASLRQRKRWKQHIEFRGDSNTPHASEQHNVSSRPETVGELEQVPMEILSRIPNVNKSSADLGVGHKDRAGEER